MGDKPFRPVLAGPFAGPVQGVSIIDNALRALMARRGLDPAIIELSPGARRRGPGYHAVRIARTATGFLRILAWGLGGRRRTVMSLDGAGGLAYNIVLMLALRLTGQQVMFYHHSSNYVLHDKVLMRLLLRLAGGVPQVFCSRRMAQLFQDRYGAGGQALIVNNAAWVEPAPEVRRPDGNGVRLGYLGALSLDKGLGRAIETLRVLLGRGVAAQLSLAGAVSGDEARALLESARAEFGPGLVMHGVLQGGAKAAFLSALDYFLFPSLYPHETQSLVVPEALSAGAPVIAIDHRFVGEVLGDGGLLIPSGADYAQQAADWIMAGQAELAERRRRARAQFAASHAEAAGQVDRLIAWSTGGA